MVSKIHRLDKDNISKALNAFMWDSVIFKPTITIVFFVSVRSFAFLDLKSHSSSKAHSEYGSCNSEGP